ncbi:MAG: hypothetical protein IKX65_05315 [Prevotella sp.]|nr:hypothetical protein [Prevotella sp.]
MKVKELLQTFEFDDLFPTIAIMYPNAKRHKREFKEAFDILTTMKSTASNKTVRYMLIEDPATKDNFFGAQDSNFNTSWDVLVGKEVKRDKFVDLTDEEMAANIIINAIFISKCPKEFEENQRALKRA